MAEYSPAIPTSGDVKDPRTNGNRPKSAEALPAIWPCFSIANVNEVEEMTANDPINKKIGIATAISGAFNRRAASNTAPAMLAVNNPIFKKVVSDIKSAKRPTN